MSQPQGFDLTAAHRFFSADCFNKAWTLIEKPDRTPEEDEEMIRLNQASLSPFGQTTTSIVLSSPVIKRTYRREAVEVKSKT